MKDHDSINFDEKDDTERLQLDGLKLSEEKIEEEINRDSEDSEEEDTEEIEWDGSESEFVEDDDYQEYEENYSGIKFSYTLKKEEFFSCIKCCGIDKRLIIIGSFLLAIFTIIYLILFIQKMTMFNFFCMSLGIILLPLWASGFLPLFFEKLNKDKFPGNKKVSVEVYPDSIIVDDNMRRWEIPLDGTSRFKEINGIFLIFLPKEKIFIIPKRAIEPDLLPEVEAMLVTGTEPYENTNKKNK